jgi:hypothetical protein
MCSVDIIRYFKKKNNTAITPLEQGLEGLDDASLFSHRYIIFAVEIAEERSVASSFCQSISLTNAGSVCAICTSVGGWLRCTR